jgi:N-acetylmuramoyl-L-alanine amidase
VVKVALVVGHRSKKQGAVGSAGISEWEFNRALAKEIAKESIENVEMKVFYRDDAPDGYGEKMRRLHKRIDAWGADYSISMHFNATKNKKVDGHEVLYCSNYGQMVAKLLNDKFNEFLANRDRGVKRVSKKERGGGFLCRGKSICVLAEPYFAAHQGHYIPGSSGYKALKRAYIEFIKELGSMGKVRDV